MKRHWKTFAGYRIWSRATRTLSCTVPASTTVSICPTKPLKPTARRLSWNLTTTSHTRDWEGFYFYRGRYLEAAEQFQKAIARAPDLLDAYTDLAGAMTDLGRNQEAEQALLMSLKLRETAPAWNNLGAIRAYQGRDADAVKYYTRAVTMWTRASICIGSI